MVVFLSNPKSEIRNPKHPCPILSDFGFRISSLLLGRFAELLVRFLHGGLEVLAGLFPGLVLERDRALAHLLALVLAGVLAAAAEAGAVVVSLAHVFLHRRPVGLACTVILPALV